MCTQCEQRVMENVLIVQTAPPPPRALSKVGTYRHGDSITQASNFELVLANIAVENGAWYLL